MHEPRDEWTCRICGKQVSKRKSLQYGDGRACKEHPQVAAAAAAKQADESKRKADEAATKEREEKKRREWYSPSPERVRERSRVLHTTCGAEGYTRQVEAGRIPVAMEKVRLKGHPDIHPFHPKWGLVIDETGLRGKARLADLPVSHRVRLRGRWMWDLAQGLGFERLCEGCAKAAGLDFQEAWAPKLPDGFDAVKMMQTGAILGELMRPAIEAEAVAEIRDQAATN